MLAQIGRKFDTRPRQGGVIRRDVLEISKARAMLRSPFVSALAGA